jgi:hypothetical protein
MSLFGASSAPWRARPSASSATRGGDTEAEAEAGVRALTLAPHASQYDAAKSAGSANARQRRRGGSARDTSAKYEPPCGPLEFIKNVKRLCSDHRLFVPGIKVRGIRLMAQHDALSITGGRTAQPCRRTEIGAAAGEPDPLLRAQHQCLRVQPAPLSLQTPRLKPDATACQDSVKAGRIYPRAQALRVKAQLFRAAANQ